MLIMLFLNILVSKTTSEQFFFGIHIFFVEFPLFFLNPHHFFEENIKFFSEILAAALKV